MSFATGHAGDSGAKASDDGTAKSGPPKDPSDQAAPTHAPKIHGPADLAKLSLAALGVVYGDIGTSPLYAMKECFNGEHGVPITPDNVLGIVSLVFWSLTLVIVVKYMAFVMRADNHGEGGILALLALLKPRMAYGEKQKLSVKIYVLLGLFGAALLYGDGVITPAISVLSAVEGLGANQTPAPDTVGMVNSASQASEAMASGAGRAANGVAQVAVHVAHTGFLSSKPFIVAVTVLILVVLFLAQKRGTDRVGAVFGPTMLVWLATIAGLGIYWIAKHPSVLVAVNPIHAANFFARNGKHGFLILGAVVLCITGGEALYADMGHFGRRPIRVAWFSAVYPALLLCYFGQAALMLERGAVENPFFAMVSGVWRYPLVAIATMAAIIASQALISGAYSITQQAVQLGYWPRVTIKHTSGKAEGQIFIPEINSALMIACIVLVVTLQESSALAAAYGIAVTGAMTTTSILYFGVTRRWGWNAFGSLLLVAGFLTIDLSFFAANATKIHEGGWFPLAVGVAIFTLMTTWHAGRRRLGEQIRAATLPMTVFLDDLAQTKPHRVKGTAIFMTSNPDGAPPAMLHHFKHNKVLHEQVILLSIQTRHVPEIAPSARIEKIVDLGHGLYQVVAVFGFMQLPNVLEVLQLCRRAGLQTNAADTSFFLGRETLLITDRRGMAKWRKGLFSFMSRNARPANAFFSIPSNRVVELGTQIEL